VSKGTGIMRCCATRRRWSSSGRRSSLYRSGVCSGFLSLSAGKLLSRWGFAFAAGILVSITVVQPIQGQSTGELVRVPGILENYVATLHARGDSLWVSPDLNLTADGGITWHAVEHDSLRDLGYSVMSMDGEGEVFWAGLGYTSTATGVSLPAAGGFLFSVDGGQTFRYRFPQLDVPGDTLIEYGVSTLSTFDAVIPENSPPYGVDYDAKTGALWVAGGWSGLRRSSDGGNTWERVVLPPDDLEAIHPDSSYTFRLDPEPARGGSYNHRVLSVLVDEAGVIWAGTMRGLNRSTDGGISWRRYSYDGTPGSIVGDRVVAIEEQPVPGRNPVWVAGLQPGEGGVQTPQGVAVTRDGGETFEQVLVGVNVGDIAFSEGIVYAAAFRDGLFISEDDGVTWRSVKDFFDPAHPDRAVNPDLSVLSVATTREAVWVGTSDGLFRSTDRGATWQAFRANVPVHPEVPTADVPDVDTYAYPNPFSPASDNLVRIRYDLDSSGNVEVRIFDFEMSLVRRLTGESQATGGQEVAWDGTDDNGLRVAKGVYFYAVRADNRTVWGKILVL